MNTHDDYEDLPQSDKDAIWNQLKSEYPEDVFDDKNRAMWSEMNNKYDLRIEAAKEARGIKKNAGADQILAEIMKKNSGISVEEKNNIWIQLQDSYPAELFDNYNYALNNQFDEEYHRLVKEAEDKSRSSAMDDLREYARLNFGNTQQPLYDVAKAAFGETNKDTSDTYAASLSALIGGIREEALELLHEMQQTDPHTLVGEETYPLTDKIRQLATLMGDKIDMGDPDMENPDMDGTNENDGIWRAIQEEYSEVISGDYDIGLWDEILAIFYHRVDEAAAARGGKKYDPEYEIFEANEFIEEPDEDDSDGFPYDPEFVEVRDQPDDYYDDFDDPYFQDNGYDGEYGESYDGAYDESDELPVVELPKVSIAYLNHDGYVPRQGFEVPVMAGMVRLAYIDVMYVRDTKNGSTIMVIAGEHESQNKDSIVMSIDQARILVLMLQRALQEDENLNNPF